MVYKSIPDEYNHFEVSNYGRVKNTNTGHILKPSLLRSGYYSIRVQIGDRQHKKHIIVHKAVANTFIENKDNLPMVNHIDGDKTNNIVTNLEWCTASKNTRHAYQRGLIDTQKISGENNHASKLCWDDVKEIRQTYCRGKSGFGKMTLARKFGVSKDVISKIIDRITWKEPINYEM